jgi:hypothetical protein
MQEVWDRLLREHGVERTRGVALTPSCRFGKLPGKLSHIDYNGERPGDYGENSFWDTCVVGKRHFEGNDEILMDPFQKNEYVVSVINPCGHETVLKAETLMKLWRDPFTMAPLEECVVIPWLNVSSAEMKRVMQPVSDRVLRSSQGTKKLEGTCPPNRPSSCALPKA